MHSIEFNWIPSNESDLMDFIPTYSSFFSYAISMTEGIYSLTHVLTQADDNNLSVFTELYQYSVGW